MPPVADSTAGSSKSSVLVRLKVGVPIQNKKKMYIKAQDIQTNQVYKYEAGFTIHFFIFSVNDYYDKYSNKLTYQHYRFSDNYFIDEGIKTEINKAYTDWYIQLADKEDIKFLNNYIQYGVFL